jgi:hypothetical protein
VVSTAAWLSGARTDGEVFLGFVTCSGLLRSVEDYAAHYVSVLAAADTGSDVADAATRTGMSFSAGTKLLLASGAAIPISQLSPGDKVLAMATNVKTSRTRAETVKTVVRERDTDLIRADTAGWTWDLTVTSDHDYYPTSAVIAI